MSGIAAGLLAAGVGLFLPLSYNATAHVVLSMPATAVGPEQAGEDSLEEAAQRAAQSMLSDAVIRSAGERVPGSPGPDAVVAALSITPSSDGGLVSITATDSTPGGARALADAVGEAYIDVAAADTADRYARRIEGLESERQSLQAQLVDVWDAFGRRAASLRATAGPLSTVAAVIGSDPLLQQLQDDGERIAERLSTVERSIVDAEAATTLAPIERQELVHADVPPSARGSMVRRSAALAVPVGVLFGAILAWRRAERERPVSVHQAPGFRLLGRLPATAAGPAGTADARTLNLWRQMRLMAANRRLDDLVILELPSPRRSAGAAQRLLEAAREDGCVVRDGAVGGPRRGAEGDARPPGVLRVVRATSTAVLSSVSRPGHTAVVLLGVPSADLEHEVRVLDALATAAGAEILGVLIVEGGRRRRGRPRSPFTSAAADGARPPTVHRRGAGHVR
jgi:hypothetical protein